MLKRDTFRFTLVETVLVSGIIILLFAAGFFVYHRENKPKGLLYNMSFNVYKPSYVLPGDYLSSNKTDYPATYTYVQSSPLNSYFNYDYITNSNGYAAYDVFSFNYKGTGYNPPQDCEGFLPEDGTGKTVPCHSIGESSLGCTVYFGQTLYSGLETKGYYCKVQDTVITAVSMPANTKAQQVIMLFNSMKIIKPSQLVKTTQIFRQ